MLKTRRPIAASRETFLTTCFLPAVLLAAGCSVGDQAAIDPLVHDAWKQIPVTDVGGILGERLKVWRENRLWSNIEDPYLLAGFESRPGTHPWQGEHVGKWLHAATLAHQATGDPKLLASLQETVKRLIATQQENGYFGTYAPEGRLYADWENENAKVGGSWDVWIHRYNLYGFLTYEKFHSDADVVAACIKAGDLLLETFGPGGRDITQIGTKNGISSMTLLESVMMLYERTREERFLQFAEHLVASSEAREDLRLLSAMLAGEDVSGPGLGKAYQLMANLLGYGELYRHTGDAKYLEAVRNGWENIRAEHTFETGGPWGYVSREGQNVECFSPSEYLHPSNDVETCSTTTWIQLSLQLLRMTGEAKYGSEAERALLNHLFGAQAPDGTNWAYFTQPNCSYRKYESKIHCCASSGPRALEMYARHLAGEAGGALSINSYLPLSAKLTDSATPVRGLSIEGAYPFEDRATLELDLASAEEFAVDFRLPDGAKSLAVRIGGETQTLTPMSSGFLRLERVWEPGETIELVFDFAVEAHLTTGRDGSRWATFTRGPLTLAEDVEKDSESDIRIASDDLAGLADSLEAVSEESSRQPTYRIPGSNSVLIPYYLAGSTGNGVRTLFPVE